MASSLTAGPAIVSQPDMPMSWQEHLRSLCLIMPGMPGSIPCLYMLMCVQDYLCMHVQVCVSAHVCTIQRIALDVVAQVSDTFLLLVAFEA